MGKFVNTSTRANQFHEFNPNSVDIQKTGSEAINRPEAVS